MENRLNLLCEAGVIDSDIRSGMLKVVKRLDAEWRLPVYSEQGEMAITHMANALMRSRRGEVIAPLDGDILQEIRLSSLWSRVHQAHCALLQEFAVTVHENEEGYLLANLYGLWLVNSPAE
ncbi:PRD domain-containing protein [Pluralibacter sp.]|uniref:PRD domain-containing protein n=1 Tax=Pluralibacter sp. TaxID=1920032 RepID=UPI0025E056E5|nr:PRD domain-containing protein [Pluralibacter sp.]MBV8044215.1 PRD domain-containing protein [Pluralibacter sp.]